jgi:hypothetical protein
MISTPFRPFVDLGAGDVVDLVLNFFFVTGIRFAIATYIAPFITSPPTFDLSTMGARVV